MLDDYKFICRINTEQYCITSGNIENVNKSLNSSLFS